MDFIAQAFKGKVKWNHYFIGTIFSFLAMQFGAIPLLFAGDFADVSLKNKTNLNPGIDNNLFLLLMIIPFALGLFGLYIAVKNIHHLPFLKVLTARHKLDWNRVFYAFMLWFFISGAMLLTDYFMTPQHYVSNFKWLPFAILVLVSVLFIPLQTSFEEVYFRGYLMQGFGVITRYRVLALIITSTAFGLLHGANPEVEKLGNILLIYYIVTGFFFGIITLIDDGLELSLGLHAANNIFAAIFVTTNWTVFQTDALFIDRSEPQINWMLFAPLFVLYPLIILWFSRKYNWSNWKHKLLGNVEKPIEVTEEKAIK